MTDKHNYLLYLALIFELIIFNLWTLLPEGSFYKVNALFIFLISSYIYVNDRKNFVKFVLFELSLVYLLDELFFNPTKLTLFEALTIIIVPLIWYIKYGKYSNFRILERIKCVYRFCHNFFNR